MKNYVLISLAGILIPAMLLTALSGCRNESLDQPWADQTVEPLRFFVSLEGNDTG